MINSLFDRKTMKRFDDLARKQAKLNEKKHNLTKDTMNNLDSEVLTSIFDIVEKYGHPNEQRLVVKLKNKYNAGENLEFEDLKNLNDLYKSNLNKFSRNKDIINE